MYLPLIVLLVGQALFATLMPSTSTAPTRTVGGSENLGPDGSVDGGGPEGVTGGDDATAGTTGGNGRTPSSIVRVQTRGGKRLIPGDTSHCRRGLQTGLVALSPPCAPVFAGDNGGATTPGVSATDIELMVFWPKPDPQIDAILEAGGLQDSEEEMRAFAETAVKFLNDHYEFFGRRLKLSWFRSECVAPDVDACRGSIQEAKRRHPFALWWLDYSFPDLEGELARAGIITWDVGGFDGSHYQTFAPFRWSFGMDSGRSSVAASEYICKSMAGRPVSHSGPVVHATIGVRDSTPRKFGIVSQEWGANRLAAERLKRQLAGCGQKDISIYTHDYNLETQGQQGAAIVSAMINDGVTSVLWSTDSFTGVFYTPIMTGQSYFPENILAGGTLFDVDEFGRLMDPEQWAHAFGISALSRAVHYQKSEAAKIWKTSGPSTPYDCKQCVLMWADFSSIGGNIQQAGPRLTPGNFERGAFSLGRRGGWKASGGDPRVPLITFGPGDYTALSDFREVYWDGAAFSEFDGSEGGAYVAVDRGRRYEPGQYPKRPLKVPVPST